MNDNLIGTTKETKDQKKPMTAKETIAGKDFSLSNIQNLSFEDFRLKMIDSSSERSLSFESVKRRVEQIVDQNIINFIRNYFCETNELSSDNADRTGNYMENETFYIKTPGFFAKIPIAFFHEAKENNYTYEFKNIPTRAVNTCGSFDSQMTIGEVEYSLKVMMLKVIAYNEEKNLIIAKLKGAD